MTNLYVNQNQIVLTLHLSKFKKTYIDGDTTVYLSRLIDDAFGISILFKNKLLIDWQMPFKKDSVCIIKCDIPKDESWSPFLYRKLFNVEKVSYNTYKYKGKDVSFTIEHILSKSDAKALWKYINKKGFVSPLKWDSWIGEYDCYCKFCEADGHRSWVSNPDSGYVWPRKDGALSYKEKSYDPCHGNLYERLVFQNKQEYNGNDFDDLFTNYPLSQADIDRNGNVIGGAWRNVETGEIVEKPYSCESYEKVVTTGIHRTQIKNAVECPVCRDLHEILCRSEYDPKPFSIRRLFLIIENKVLYNNT